MRHRKAGVKLGRTSSHRKAMFRNMVTSLFKYEKIRTTDVKAKELRSWADHLVTLAKRGDLHARRQALSIIREKAVVHKLFAEANEKFGSRQGGYTRVIKMGRRPGDAAPISIVELITTTGAGGTKPAFKAKEEPIPKEPDSKQDEDKEPVEPEKEPVDEESEPKDADLVQKEDDSEPAKDESEESEKDEDMVKQEEFSEKDSDASEKEAGEKENVTSEKDSGKEK